MHIHVGRIKWSTPVSLEIAQFSFNTQTNTVGHFVESKFWRSTEWPPMFLCDVKGKLCNFKWYWCGSLYSTVIIYLTKTASNAFQRPTWPIQAMCSFKVCTHLQKQIKWWNGWSLDKLQCTLIIHLVIITLDFIHLNININITFKTWCKWSKCLLPNQYSILSLHSYMYLLFWLLSTECHMTDLLAQLVSVVHSKPSEIQDPKMGKQVIWIVSLSRRSAGPLDEWESGIGTCQHRWVAIRAIDRHIWCILHMKSAYALRMTLMHFSCVKYIKYGGQSRLLQPIYREISSRLVTTRCNEIGHRSRLIDLNIKSSKEGVRNTKIIDIKYITL